MIPNLGISTANLALSPHPPDPDLIDHLNQSIRPDKPLTADDIHIRTLLVTSTAVNAYGGRFAANDLPQLCDLLIDSPVLIGHRKDSLPVARVFLTDIVNRDSAPWVRAWFYWLKSADGSSTLRDNVDGGIYKECSLSFTYQFPECSLCGKDIRLCRHEPLSTYQTPIGRQTCHFIYRRIEKVLETSLVYRGAVENTRVGNNTADSTAPIDLTTRPSLLDLDDLPPGRRYLITPAYDGIPVALTLTPDGLSVRSLSSDKLPDKLASEFPTRDISGLRENFGLLVGYHGQQRCSLDDLRRYLTDRSRPVTRLVVHLFPHPAIRLPLPPYTSSPHSICPMSYRIAGAKEITALAPMIHSKAGVDLWPLEELPPLHPGWRYNPSRRRSGKTPRYTLTRHPIRPVTLLVIESDRVHQQFILHQFDMRGLMRGCRFVADPVGPDTARLFTADNSDQLPVARYSGALTKFSVKGDGLAFTAETPMRGHFIIRPVLLDNRSRFLFYRKRE